MHKIKTAIIGGSGLYEIEGVEIIDEISVDTPWGSPSDRIVIAGMGGQNAAFLPRHGKGHVFLPHEVNYRANIAALKMIGVEQIFAPRLHHARRGIGCVQREKLLRPGGHQPAEQHKKKHLAPCVS